MEHYRTLIFIISYNSISNQQRPPKIIRAGIDRKSILEAIRYVDEVIPETCWEQKISDVVDNQIDIFVMGDDWEGQFDFLKEYCEVVYLPRTDGISTTKIKSDLNKK